MLETSHRLLRLLALLQTPRDWTGPQLAERLAVSVRTVRNDVGRLRALGYPVHATRGAAGGYRLGAGSALPPLLLEPDEAVAVAISLRIGAEQGAVTGIAESALRALTKLEQVLPSRIRRRVGTLWSHVSPLAGFGAPVDADMLATIANAARDHERLRFQYTGHDGSQTEREVEPYQLVHTRARWYLSSWDVHRADWRTFRVDRIRLRIPHGPCFQPRSPPAGGFAAYVERGLGTASWQHLARVTVHAPAAQIRARLPSAVRIDERDADVCVVHVGSDSPEQLAQWLGMLGADFEVVAPPELVTAVRRLADRYTRATP